MSAITTPRPERDARLAATDVRGWIVLAWVAVWTCVYVYSAIGTRFPWIRDWIDGLLPH